jgi:hypothetical protein
VCAVLQREAKQGELDAVTKLLQEKQFIRKGIVQAAEKWASAVGATTRHASHLLHHHASQKQKTRTCPCQDAAHVVPCASVCAMHALPLPRVFQFNATFGVALTSGVAFYAYLVFVGTYVCVAPTLMHAAAVAG